MKFVQLIIQISFLYLLLFIGNLIQQKFDLIIPGSIIGMLILFCLLYLPFFKEKWVRYGSNFLNKHLTLLFIPATVGIIQYSSLLNIHGFISIIIVLISTMLVFIFSVIISSYLSSRSSKNQPKENNMRSELNERI
ncbi:CidA/LrgA family protein [Bacillus sp. EAC]|uniref:CidA/LrgA family protein n=1 Tax=Bacillus sp. EAC TaxID=1978338 RepID=UPI0015C4F398|nr:CidA/LrgA family protein [Bacillus sp. EAC]